MKNNTNRGEMNFSLIKNKLVSSVNQTDFLPKTMYKGIKTFEHAIDDIAREGTTLTKDEVRATVNMLSEIIVKYLIEGYKVHLPFAKFKITVKGRFIDGDENIEGESEAVVRVSAGPQVKEAAKKVDLTRSEKGKSSIFSMKNLTTRLATFTGGDIAVIKGVNIGFETGSPFSGLFLVDAAETEHRVTEFSEIAKSRIKFNVPALPAGDYSVKIALIDGNNTTTTKMEGFITIT